MIFHPLYCSARKVNMCYKTWGEAGLAPSWPLGQGAEGPLFQALCTHHSALALPHFRVGENNIQRS